MNHNDSKRRDWPNVHKRMGPAKRAAKKRDVWKVTEERDFPKAQRFHINTSDALGVSLMVGDEVTANLLMVCLNELKVKVYVG